MNVVLRHVGVIDGTGAPLRDDACIVLDGDRITAVADDNRPAGADDVDLRGHTVLPGFVDAHVHLVFTGGDDPLGDVTGTDDAGLYELAARNAATALAAGITTVRDCGSRGLVAQRVRDDVSAGHIIGPRILVAGPPICAPRGHLWFMGGVLASDLDAADAVRRRAADGVDHIKVMASGGHMTPGSDSRAAELSLTALTTITATAHELGLSVAAHAHSTEAIARCVTAGVDTIEHCGWLGTTDGFDYRPEVVEQMLAKGIAVSPTVPVYFRRDPARLSGDDAEVAYMRAIVAGRRETTARMHRAGVPVIIGSDAGCRGIAFDSFADIVPVYTDTFGLTPLAAIRAATAGAANALGIGHVVGTIAPGMTADLVVLDGDPTVDLGALSRVRRVYRDGICVVRD